MGLDAYFYRKPKQTKVIEPITSDMLVDAFHSERLKDALTVLQKWADANDYTLEQALYQAIDNFNNDKCDGGWDSKDEVLYFRKFHYLLDYFEYGDDEYSKDMTVTKEQCEELYARAEKCLRDVDKYLAKQNGCSATHDCESGVLLNYTVLGDMKETKLIHKHINEITNKAFPCSGCNDSYIDHISRLFTGMRNILQNTDWETEEIVFNADW